MMNSFTKLYKYAICFLALGCVDDYQDANPPSRLDAPYSYTTSSVEEGEDGIPAVGGEEVTFNVNIVDAPGRLGEISYLFSQGGEVVSSTFDAVRGQTSGSFQVVVRAPANLSGATTFTMSITDQQSEPKVLTVSRVLDVEYAFEGPDFNVVLGAPSAQQGDQIPVVVTINAVPSGGVASISVAGSAGSVAFNQSDIDALVGKSSGTITGILTPGTISATGERNVIVAITDQLQNRQQADTASILLICPALYETDENPATKIAGSYKAVVEGSTGYDSTFFGLEAMVVITKVNEGQFLLSDVSFGVNESFYNEDGEPRTNDPDEVPLAPQEGVINICGRTISAAEEEEEITISGTVEESIVPGTLVLQWTNENGDTGRAILTKM